MTIFLCKKFSKKTPLTTPEISGIELRKIRQRVTKNSSLPDESFHLFALSIVSVFPTINAEHNNHKHIRDEVRIWLAMSNIGLNQGIAVNVVQAMKEK